MDHSESWEEGFEAGYDWFIENSGSALEQGFGVLIPDKPYRAGDSEFNEGVEDGIVEARSKRE